VLLKIRSRALPYLARQMLRVKTWITGETGVLLVDLFGSGVREVPAFHLSDEEL
jgi:hypothetical protein